MLLCKALTPKAILFEPDVLLSKALTPKATLYIPTEFPCKAFEPKATLKFPDVFSCSVFFPIYISLISAGSKALGLTYCPLSRNPLRNIMSFSR